MKVSLLLKFSAILWVIWGLVHVFAGIMVISSDTMTAIQAIANGVDKNLLVGDYPKAAGAIMNQHGWNLTWFGVTTTIGAIYIWRGSETAIFVTAMIGGLADMGYFMFLDLGGYITFFPGTVVTMISALAITLSFIGYYKCKSKTN